MSDEEVWGVILNYNGEDARWFRHHKGEPRRFTKDHARAMADTLNRGGMSGACEARLLPIPLPPKHQEKP